MTLKLQPVNQKDVETFVCWEYEAPFDVYNLGCPPDAEDLAYFLDPQNNFHRITNDAGDLLAFCSFGRDAQVPGGDYDADALDIGMGVRPDLTGQGNGHLFARAVVEFGRVTFVPTMYRVSIADFNKRARRVWEKNGFYYAQSFESTINGMLFNILVKSA